MHDVLSSRTIEILRDLTRERAGVDVGQLERLSNTLVYVRCTVCGEQFQRHFQIAHLPHACRGLPNEATLPNTQRPVRLECKLKHPLAKLPYRKRVTDAGYDIHSIEDTVIPPKSEGGRVDVRTGIIVVCPPGYYLTIDGRSNLRDKGVKPFRNVIDATYTGELSVIMTNSSQKPYPIRVGDRIAQIIIHAINHCDFTVLADDQDFSPEYNQRGTDGFGSSGR